MKLVTYELKKIFNIKLIAVLVMFTALFYNLFVSSLSYAENDFGNEERLGSILLARYGTTMPFARYGDFEKIRQEYVKKMDKVVKADPVMKKYHIDRYAEMRKTTDADNAPAALSAATNKIVFTTNGEDCFLIQEIEYVQEWGSVWQHIGLDAHQAKVNVAKNMKANSYDMKSNSYTIDRTRARLENLYQRDQYSTLPNEAAHYASSDIPRILILILLSLAVLLIPYQIRERQSDVNQLFFTTRTGRRIWYSRIRGMLIAALLTGAVQCLVFAAVLAYKGILKYVGCPMFNMLYYGNYYCWFDIDFGTYLLLNFALMIIFGAAAAMIFMLISKYAANHIAGIAVAIPVLMLLSLISLKLILNFLLMKSYQEYTVALPLIVTAALSAAAAVMCLVLIRHEKTKDVLTC